jgi:sulfur dioxygenase
MTPNELNARTHHVRIVDVREPREYCADLGHIAGSLLVPSPSSSLRHDDGLATMSSCGFESVTNLTGGMLAWHDARLPVER